MEDYEPAFLGHMAEFYDEQSVRGDEAETIAFLEDLARGGPALELAIGTGRIALPLAARGIVVDGIELSPDMVAQLRKKPGGDKLAVKIGSFADVGVDGSYELIYVVFNTFFNLLTQDDQVRCFENVAAHLADGGAFVIEAGPPNWLHKLDRDQHADAQHVGVASVTLDLLRHYPLTQTLEENHVHITPDGIRMEPVVQRYCWNSELDLMARIAGLTLKERWADWTRTPLAADSPNCISVYGR